MRDYEISYVLRELKSPGNRKVKLLVFLEKDRMYIDFE